METRIAVISMILENASCAERVNAILHEYGECVIGRMGIPYRQKGVLHHQRGGGRAARTPSAPFRASSGVMPGVSLKTAYSGRVSDGSVDHARNR